MQEEREQLQGVCRYKQMGEKKGGFKLIARAHVSLIKKSTKGLELFYDIVVLHGMYSFKPAITRELVHTGMLSLSYLWYLTIFRVLWSLLRALFKCFT